MRTARTLTFETTGREKSAGIAVDAGNLAIDYSVFNLQVFSDPGGEFGEAAEEVSIAGD